MTTPPMVSSRTDQHEKAHRWCARVALFLAALFMALDLSTLDRIKLPEVFSSGLVVPLSIFFTLSLATLVLALAFSNFAEIVKRSGQFLVLTGVLMVVRLLFLIVHGLISTGFPVRFNSDPQVYYPEIVATFCILTGVAIIRLLSRSRRTDSDVHPQHIKEDALPQIERSNRVGVLLRKLIACIFDYGVYAVICFLLSIPFGERATPAPSDAILAWNPSTIGLILFVVAWIIYFVGIESVWRRSLGMFILGLEIRREYPQDKMLKVSILRHFLDPIEIFPWGFLPSFYPQRTAGASVSVT